MDILHDYTSTLLTFYMHTLWPALKPARSLASSAYATLAPQLSPLIERFLQVLHESPAYVGVGILLLTLLVSLQVLNVLRKIMLWWTRLVLRLVFWGLVLAMAVVVWQRGLERTVMDLAGWGAEVREVWWREYRRWEGVSRQMEIKRGAGAGAGAGSYGYGYGNR